MFLCSPTSNISNQKIQLYSEYYNAKTKAYIDWFVTRGGEGKASLEKDLTDVEEKVFDQWKKDVQHDLKTIEQVNNIY